MTSKKNNYGKEIQHIILK